MLVVAQKNLYKKPCMRCYYIHVTLRAVEVLVTVGKLCKPGNSHCKRLCLFRWWTSPLHQFEEIINLLTLCLRIPIFHSEESSASKNKGLQLDLPYQSSLPTWLWGQSSNIYPVYYGEGIWCENTSIPWHRNSTSQYGSRKPRSTMSLAI